MPTGRSWSGYRPKYRAREMQILANWIQAGRSGAVVGSAGIGKSNLLGFLCNTPGAIERYLPSTGFSVALIPVDLNNLPANDTSTLYRVILRSLYDSRGKFEPTLQQLITSLYLENREAIDPFLPHSALREALLHFQAQGVRVVLVLDRFDWFCENVSPRLTDTLRGLRDSFKDSLCFIVGMRIGVTFLSDPEVLGELYELLDTYVCWVQPMQRDDALQLITDETAGALDLNFGADVDKLLRLSGGYPSLLKACCHWWLNTSDRRASDWSEALMGSASIKHRLENIWKTLTLGEQQVLDEISEWNHKNLGRETGSAEIRKDAGLLIPNDEQLRSIDLLVKRGLISKSGPGWQILSSLLARHVVGVAGYSPGTIWVERSSGLLHQGRTSLDTLSPLEYRLLDFLVRNPRIRHKHTELIEAVWPEDILSEGVTTEALYQIVRGLRRKIEPQPSRPRYVVNWRGSPEGGYQCFPEGRPD